MTVPIPRSAADITPAWLSTALSADVADVSIRESIGGTSTKILLDIAYTESPALPTTMCLKAGMGDHAEFMAPVGIYATEARFFRDERHNSGVKAPRVYWADYDEHMFGAVLMEDLSRREVRFCSVATPLTVDEVSAVLENVAVLHAGRWNDPWLDDAEWLEDFSDPNGKKRGYFSMLTPSVVGEFVDQRRHTLPKELLDPERLVDLFWAFVGVSNSGPRTLLHGDLHIGNVYFDGSEAGLCDWQVVSRGSPAFDLAYLLGSALTIEQRRESERDLLRHYVRALTAAGAAKPLEFDELWSLYRAQMAYGLFAWLCTPEVFQTGDIIDEVLRRFGAAVVELETADAVGLQKQGTV